MANGTPETEGGNKSGGIGNAPSIEIPDTKRGRGRPPMPRDASGNIIRPSEGAAKNKPAKLVAPTRTESVPNPDATKSAKFLGEGAVGLVELAESLVQNVAVKKIAKKRPDKLTEFKAICEETSLRPKEKALIAGSVEQIALRHDWMTKYAPEVLLGVVLTQYATRQILLLKFVDNITKDSGPSVPKNAQAKVPDETSSIPAPTAGVN